MRWLNVTDHTFEKQFQALLMRKQHHAQSVEANVKDIINDVRQHGDQSLIEKTLQYDNIDISTIGIRVKQSEIENALTVIPKKQMEALKLAHLRITSFHQRQIPIDDYYDDEYGNSLGLRWRPLSSVGLYVPGGTAAYPSSVLMNATPAFVAGVKRIAMVVPTSFEGQINPLVLASAHLNNIDEIYRIGGAQAIAALAYGTKTIHCVDKIVGPGNTWVAAAKKQVFGDVGIDMIAGPSEILIVSDKHNNPEHIAMDLLSQAEHDPSSQSILITDDESFGKQVCHAVNQVLQQLQRRDIAQASWENFGAVIHIDNLQNCSTLIDTIAPEHLELAIDNPELLANQVHHAGAIFLGRYTPEAIGDYVGGPNHVLPTQRSARYASGLGVLDFMKRTSLLSCTQKGLNAIGPAAVTLAECEGLHAHALSITQRMDHSKD